MGKELKKQSNTSPKNKGVYRKAKTINRVKVI